MAETSEVNPGSPTGSLSSRVLRGVRDELAHAPAGTLAAVFAIAEVVHKVFFGEGHGATVPNGRGSEATVISTGGTFYVVLGLISSSYLVGFVSAKAFKWIRAIKFPSSACLFTVFVGGLVCAWLASGIITWSSEALLSRRSEDSFPGCLIGTFLIFTITTFVSTRENANDFIGARSYYYWMILFYATTVIIYISVFSSTDRELVTEIFNGRRGVLPN